MKMLNTFMKGIVDRLVGYPEEIITNLTPNYFKLPVFYSFQKFNGTLEPEIEYIKDLVLIRKRAIDIGANKGMYTYALSKIFEVVEVFEPQVYCTNQIKAYSEKFHSNINIHNVALSNELGMMELKIPVCRGFLRTTYSSVMATFEELECEYKSRRVDVHRLDDYNFQDVSFIKIDVQGHERKVLSGAKNTIAREKPILIVEIEQQFLPDVSVRDVFDEILNMGYEGQFVYENTLYSLNKFSFEKHQHPFLDSNHKDFQNRKKYVNNFIFQPHKASGV